MNNMKFQDFEAYADVIRDVNVEPRLLRLFEPHWHMRQVEAGQFRIQYAVEGSGFLTEGSVTPNGWGLLLPVSGNPMLVNGKPLLNNSVAILPARSEFRISSIGPMQWISIYLPSDLIEDVVQASAERKFVDVVPNSALAIQQLTLNIRNFVSANEVDSPFVSSSPAATAFAEQLAAASNSILGACEARSHVDSKPTANRRQLVAKAIEIIHDCSDGTLAIRELARATGISERTLLSAFRQYLGISPKEYLIVSNLHKARRMLREGSPDAISVASIAARLGFWDFGRFSGRYRKLFGELPSETLRG